MKSSKFNWFKKLFCFHKWSYLNDEHTQRVCKHCKKREFLDMESDVSPWGNPIWLKSPN